MPKYTVRKMLGKADSSYIVDLMRLIETQSKQTITNWCLDYTEKNILQIYETAYPDDTRPRSALNSARECVKMLKALADVAVENEPNPAKINWRC